MHRSAHKTTFLICVGILVLIVAIHNFARYYVAKDYPFHVFTSCAPFMHSCFTADPTNSDPTFQGGAYEKVMIDAAHAPICLEEHTCANFSCDGLGALCQVTYCSPDALEDGESCTSSTQ